MRSFKARFVSYFFLLTGLAASSFWLQSCGNSSPTSAPQPTRTPTETRTPANTFTLTNTRTATNSATATSTATVTNTPTVMDTATVTSSSTNSPTPTDTPSVTQTCTETLTFTVTFTPTITNTPTHTLTVTSTVTTTSTYTTIVCPASGSGSFPNNSTIHSLTSTQTIAQRVYIPGSVRVMTVTTLFTGQGTVVKNLGLYNDDGTGTLPGALLGSGQYLDTPSSGIASVSLNSGSGISVTAGYYWLAVSSSDSNNCNVYGTTATSPAALLTGQLPNPADSIHDAVSINFAQLGYTWICP